jgi:threonine/homoserine/homoserine lactone efflux protein
VNDVASLALRGFVVGFAIAAAIGPIGLLCIRRTLADGAAAGLATGLGAATADAMYGAVAAFGLTAISRALVEARRPLGVAGGAILIGLAVRQIARAAWSRATSREMTTRSEMTVRSEMTARTTDGGDLATSFATTVALTLANPATILSFAAAFVGLGLATGGGLAAAGLVSGVFAGSAGWWCVLVGVTSVARPRIGPRGMAVVNLGSGALIALLGLLAVAVSLAQG